MPGPSPQRQPNMSLEGGQDGGGAPAGDDVGRSPVLGDDGGKQFASVPEGSPLLAEDDGFGVGFSGWLDGAALDTGGGPADDARSECSTVDGASVAGTSAAGSAAGSPRRRRRRNPKGDGPVDPGEARIRKMEAEYDGLIAARDPAFGFLDRRIEELGKILVDFEGWEEAAIERRDAVEEHAEEVLERLQGPMDFYGPQLMRYCKKMESTAAKMAEAGDVYLRMRNATMKRKNELLRLERDLADRSSSAMKAAEQAQDELASIMRKHEELFRRAGLSVKPSLRPQPIIPGRFTSLHGTGRRPRTAPGSAGPGRSRPQTATGGAQGAGPPGTRARPQTAVSRRQEGGGQGRTGMRKSLSSGTIGARPVSAVRYNGRARTGASDQLRTSAGDLATTGLPLLRGAEAAARPHSEAGRTPGEPAEETSGVTGVGEGCDATLELDPP
mmetsp:Transcript_77515/g.207079  ORF Transcript_77515/g.207079 Transcript_77515/m.207079 type:complete len:442 (+) Transcript_77515:70-1395(+)